MNQNAMNDLLPRAKRRNRMVLGSLACIAVPLCVVGSGVFNSHQQQGRLLVAVGEMSDDELRASGGNAIHHIRAELIEEKFANDQLLTAQQSDATELKDLLFGDIDAGRRVLPFTFDPSSWESTTPDRAATNSSQPAFAFDDSMRWFNGRPVRPKRTIVMQVTAYSPDERSCGESADGVTASGYSVWTNGMKLAAADTTVLPFGTLISVPGYDDGQVVPVLDRGGAIKGKRLDMLYPTHEQAQRWGTQRLDVTVWEYADGLPGDFVARFNSQSAIKD